MRVLITGGLGFLGATIAKRLAARGAQIRLFDQVSDRSLVTRIVGAPAGAFEWMTGDISKGADVDRAADGTDLIVHLAGLLTPACARDPVRGAEVNVIGTLNVFAAATRLKHAQVIYTSSASVFGKEDGANPFPWTHYGAYKLANEGAARAYFDDHGLSSVGFRPFVVYGYGRESGISAGASLACRAAARGEAYTIPFTGRTGFVYVDDIARAYEVAAFSSRTGAHLVDLDGVVASVDEVIASIRAVVPDARISAEGPVLPVVADIASVSTDPVIGALPVTPLGEGIRQTIEAYRKV
jgi:nucleoside-diphosphate-sugar epimerase